MANRAGLGFAHDLIAYDFGSLLGSVNTDSSEFTQALDLFLELTTPEPGPESKISTGMPKARALTAAHLAVKGKDKAAKRIEDSLRQFPPGFARKAVSQILDVTDEYFWEVTDRQHHLDYVEGETRTQLIAMKDRLPQ